MGTVLVLFQEAGDRGRLGIHGRTGATIIDFWAENGLEHERCGEMIERIGLANFLEGIGVEPDPNMLSHPRQSSYIRMDGWDEAAEAWFERKAEAG